MNQGSRWMGLALVVLAIGAAFWAASRTAAPGLVLEIWDNPRFEGPPILRSARSTRLQFDSEKKSRPSWFGDTRAARWSGFIDLPRTGDYRFELESDDGSRMALDGITILDNWGQHPRRTRRTSRWLEAGVHEIRIDYYNHDGGGNFDVRWRLPSGYHSVTELPVAQLSPVRPWASSVFDYVLRHLVWLLLLAAAGLVWRRPLSTWLRAVRTSTDARRVFVGGMAVFTLAASIRVIDAGAQGETCDEWAYVGAGALYAENIAGGIYSADQWKVNREHPAVGKLFYAAINALFGETAQAARRAAGVLNALTVLLAFLIALRIGRAVRRSGAENSPSPLAIATATGVVLALLPPVLAHANIGTLDTPLTFLYTVAIGGFIDALLTPERRTAMLLVAATATGFAVGVKFSAALILPFVFITWWLWHWRQIRATGQVPMPWTFYVAPALVILPMVLTWPWLWSDTLAHLVDTLGHWKKTPGAEVFMGRLTRDRPSYYFVAWFVAVIPAAALVFAAVGIGVAFIRRQRPWLVVLGWFALPFLWSFVSLKQGGYRYVYPAFIPFGLLCGLGIATVGQLAHKHGSAVLIGAMTLYLGLNVASSRPYHHYYFNEWVGGAGRAYHDRLFQIGFWGEGQQEAIEWLNEHADPRATWAFEGNVNHTLLGLRSDLRRRTGRNARNYVDWLIRDSLLPGHEQVPNFEIAYMVRTDGAPLVGVYRRTRPDRDASLDSDHSDGAPTAGAEKGAEKAAEKDAEKVDSSVKRPRERKTPRTRRGGTHRDALKTSPWRSRRHRWMTPRKPATVERRPQRALESRKAPRHPKRPFRSRRR